MTTSDTPPTGSERPRLLIVDDDEPNLEVMRELLEDQYDVVTARGGPEALQRAEAEPPDLVISDQRMPHMSGVELLERLRERCPDAVRLICTAYTDLDAVLAAIERGQVYRYVLKPWRVDDMRTTIRQALEWGAAARERRRTEDRLRRIAYTDAVSGLPNRLGFVHRLRELLAAAPGASRAVLLVDLHRFAEINFTLGHEHGDGLLREVGRRLVDGLGDAAEVARLDGDHFAVLLLDAAAPLAVAEGARRIHEVFARPFDLPCLRLDVSCAVGAAVHPTHGTTAEELLQRADVALHSSCRTSHAFAVYDPRNDAFTRRRLELIAALPRAVELGQFVLHFQPIVDLHRRSAAGLEGLVRWRHPEFGMVPPNDFIGLAEHTGAIAPLTLWVLGAALRECVAWRRLDLPLDVSVNISARNLATPGFAGQVEQAVRTTAARPEWLHLEITESTVMADPPQSLRVLGELRELGVRLSLDDFGTGYSSLAYLQKLPAHELKIDRSFVMRLATSPGDAAIVQTIAGLARNLSLEVVAEGVEDAESLDRLAGLGCHLAQGFHIARPMPAPDVLPWLATSPFGLGPLPATR
ncbi:MAG: GGDEF domain-containing response regulator [Myxococcales bacterium]|nr:GGDEF domain-containing response regulator [Myxococcales bacterium]